MTEENNTYEPLEPVIPLLTGPHRDT